MKLPNNNIKNERITIENIAQSFNEEYSFISNLLCSFNKAEKNEIQQNDVDQTNTGKKIANESAVSINGKKGNASSFGRLRNDGSSIAKRKREITVELGKLKRGNTKRMNKAQMKNKTLKLRKELLIISRGLVKEKKQSKKIESIKTDVETDNTGTDSQLHAKPKPNNENRLVFNKFKFNNEKKDRWTENKKNDVKEVLMKVLDEKKRIKKYEDKGKTEKAAKILQENAWNTALIKADGQKVKDDPAKLKMIVQRKQGEKIRSQKKWQERENVKKKFADEKQENRKVNIQAQKQKRLEKKINRRQGIKVKSKGNKKGTAKPKKNIKK